MSKVQKADESKVGAVLISDVHLDHTPPIWRSVEPDWYAAQERVMKEVQGLCDKHKSPLIVAGDLFNKWNVPPELINRAIKWFQTSYGTYTIAGQHDLPHHRYEDIKKSAYWTLVESGAIEHVKDYIVEFPQNWGKELRIYGFNWGSSYTEIEKSKSLGINLAVVHRYCWSSGHSHPGASEADFWMDQLLELEGLGYDSAVFGDNHSGFLESVTRDLGKASKTFYLLNCGSLMRRTSDQKDYKPQVGLLREDGSITPVYLDTSEDRTMEECDKLVKKEVNDTLNEFLDIIKGLGTLAADYREACSIFMRAKKTPQHVKDIVLNILEESEKEYKK